MTDLSLGHEACSEACTLSPVTHTDTPPDAHLETPIDYRIVTRCALLIFPHRDTIGYEAAAATSPSGREPK